MFALDPAALFSAVIFLVKGCHHGTIIIVFRAASDFYSAPFSKYLRASLLSVLIKLFCKVLKHSEH